MDEILKGIGHNEHKERKVNDSEIVTTVSVIYATQYPLNPIIFNNKLFFSYRGAAKVNQLAEFDGNSITLIPNPDMALDSLSDYWNNPIIYKNKPYLARVS